jgi:hypothetical protein
VAIEKGSERVRTLFLRLRELPQPSATHALGIYYITARRKNQFAICTKISRLCYPDLCILTIDFWLSNWYNSIKDKGKEMITMLKKKKNCDIETLADKTIIDLYAKMTEVIGDLMESVEDVIIKTGAVNLYPNGTDKERAVKQAKVAKMSMLVTIGIYDDLRNQYGKALLIPREERNKTNTKIYSSNFAPSYRLVEIAYRNFYKNS